MNNKKQCFWLWPDRTCTLVLSVHVLACPIGCAILVGRLERNLRRKTSSEYVQDVNWKYIILSDDLMDLLQIYSGYKLNVHHTFRKPHGRLECVLYVWFMFCVQVVKGTSGDFIVDHKLRDCLQISFLTLTH